MSKCRWDSSTTQARMSSRRSVTASKWYTLQIVSIGESEYWRKWVLEKVSIGDRHYSGYQSLEVPIFGKAKNQNTFIGNRSNHKWHNKKQQHTRECGFIFCWEFNMKIFLTNQNVILLEIEKFIGGRRETIIKDALLSGHLQFRKYVNEVKKKKLLYNDRTNKFWFLHCYSI